MTAIIRWNYQSTCMPVTCTCLCPTCTGAHLLLKCSLFGIQHPGFDYLHRKPVVLIFSAALVCCQAFKDQSTIWLNALQVTCKCCQLLCPRRSRHHSVTRCVVHVPQVLLRVLCCSGFHTRSCPRPASAKLCFMCRYMTNDKAIKQCNTLSQLGQAAVMHRQCTSRHQADWIQHSDFTDRAEDDDRSRSSCCTVVQQQTVLLT